MRPEDLEDPSDTPVAERAHVAFGVLGSALFPLVALLLFVLQVIFYLWQPDRSHRFSALGPEPMLLCGAVLLVASFTWLVVKVTGARALRRVMASHASLPFSVGAYAYGVARARHVCVAFETDAKGGRQELGNSNLRVDDIRDEVVNLSLPYSARERAVALETFFEAFLVPVHQRRPLKGVWFR